MQSEGLFEELLFIFCLADVLPKGYLQKAGKNCNRSCLVEVQSEGLLDQLLFIISLGDVLPKGGLQAA